MHSELTNERLQELRGRLRSNGVLGEREAQELLDALERMIAERQAHVVHPRTIQDRMVKKGSVPGSET